jgi:UDP-N-acetylmuramyl pentapeptide phosphotransferase/UDP-N-acetylglucosamine-1-phosphate transferase
MGENPLPFALLLSAALFACSWFSTRWLITWLAARQVLDQPNRRSSHAGATPRGGGLAIVAPLALTWAGCVGFDLLPASSLLALLAMLLLTPISFRDDLGHVPAGLRLLCQAVAVALGLASFGGQPLLFDGALPVWLDYTMAALAWLWFINLFNFMDGIDGLAGAEIVAICAGLIWFGLGAQSLLALPMLAATLGFLYWNWPRPGRPARIFMGDVGSVPLGFVLGYMLLGVAAFRFAPHGDTHWPVAVILPLYYWLDASLTLLRRLRRGEKPWQAHREHFYQLAANGKLSHRQVAQFVTLVNVMLVGLAMLTVGVFHWLGPVVVAGVTVGGLLVYFYQQR